MKNKKIIVSIVALVLILGLAFYFLFIKQDKNSALTLTEKQWIEKQKNKVIDLGITREVPNFNHEGKGVFLDFIASMEKDTKLEFNKIAYSNEETDKKEYTFEIVDKAKSSDLLFYQDNYVLLVKTSEKYDNLNAVPPMTIGVTSDDLDKVHTYLGKSDKLTYKAYDSFSTLFDMLMKEKSEVSAIAVPKNLYLFAILENKLNIAYQMTDYTKDYVLRLGKNKTLNNIIKKYYKKWEVESYNDIYTSYFAESYFQFKGISEKEKSSFRSKRYEYGFVENSPYDFTYAGKLKGINPEYMRDFSKIAGIEIKYKKYKTIESMVDDFNKNNLDFIFDNHSTASYKIDTYNTASSTDNQIAIITDLTNNKKINSIYSLNEEKVLVLKNTKIEAYLKKCGVDVISYNTMEELIEKQNSHSIIALDLYSYNYYTHKDLSTYRLAYSFPLDEHYSFVVRDIKDNKIFEEFFSFYISYTGEKNHIDNAMKDLLGIESNYGWIVNGLLYIAATIGVCAVIRVVLGLFLRPKEKKKTFTKEDKLKYIDHLTSLKNRNYLNDNIGKWDESDIYPQSILIVDLNNVAYINDNYGHKEGDAVIAEAANILIQNQVVNSEIIRTNGNEFLVYMVGYDEKQVVAYMRKLNKEFKELSHGFGAAIGYSTIVDPIKTVDDAINEATLDMRTVKEETSN